MVQIDEMQYGFMPGKGMVDALFIARILHERYVRKKKKQYMCFVTFGKGFFSCAYKGDRVVFEKERGE